MSTLTQKERDGLDEVFLSIHSSNDNYKYTKELLTLIIPKSKGYFVLMASKLAKYGIKLSMFSQFPSFSTKKKKNLSK